MRQLQRLCMAALLALMLAPGAFAGIIGTSPEPPPEPPPTTSAGTTETPPSAQPEAPATDPVVEIALGLLQNALSLL